MARITAFVFILIFILTTSLLAQSAGDYRTNGSGNWSSAVIWQQYSGSAWGAAGTAPTGSETITVQSVDSVFVDAALSISGTIISKGVVEPNDLLTFAGSGTYQHARNAGRIPISTWAEGSTLLMTGVKSTAPNDRDQNYYNIIFNTDSLTANLNMNLNNNTIYGDITVLNTGFNRWYLTAPAADSDTAVVTLMGDVFVEGGEFAAHGTSKTLTTIIVHHYGNIIVTGGNCSISRGSQPNGTTTWYLYEGNFSMSNATTQSSTNPPGNAKFVFCKAGTQILTLGEDNTLNRLPIEVSSGTTLDMGSSVLAGTGNFTLNAGATLFTALPGGIDPIFSVAEGTVILAEGSGYGFTGTTAQVTSTRMPAVVSDLYINNLAGVTLSQETTINGVLHLMAGEFDNTIPFTLGPNGLISYEGGSLKVPVSVESPALNIPASFFIEQNYPNPFNPSTTIRFGLPTVSDINVKVFDIHGQEVATLFDGRKNAGVHNLEFDAAGLSSGIYLYRIKAGENVEVKRMLLLK
jgi:hypothetical protein